MSKLWFCIGRRRRRQYSERPALKNSQGLIAKADFDLRWIEMSDVWKWVGLWKKSEQEKSRRHVADQNCVVLSIRRPLLRVNGSPGQ